MVGEQYIIAEMIEVGTVLKQGGESAVTGSSAVCRIVISYLYPPADSPVCERVESDIRGVNLTPFELRKGNCCGFNQVKIRYNRPKNSVHDARAVGGESEMIMI